jgi:hypothetical protein
MRTLLLGARASQGLLRTYCQGLVYGESTAHCRTAQWRRVYCLQGTWLPGPLASHAIRLHAMVIRGAVACPRGWQRRHAPCWPCQRQVHVGRGAAPHPAPLPLVLA